MRLQLNPQEEQLLQPLRMPHAKRVPLTSTVFMAHVTGSAPAESHEDCPAAAHTACASENDSTCAVLVFRTLTMTKAIISNNISATAMMRLNGSIIIYI